jgi:predicted nucleic acid-binding protein
LIVVVSDTSPIRALDFLGQLPLLKVLFDKVLVPPAVQNELRSPPAQFTAVDLTQFDYFEIRAPQNIQQVQQFLRVLDRGESEALALALETNAQIILMDELKGRKTAEQHGVVALGTLGILLRAKSRGLIAEVGPLIEKLDELEFFMTAELKAHVLRLAGE